MRCMYVHALIVFLKGKLEKSHLGLIFVPQLLLS